jgi:hypothetical protein
LQGRGGRGRLCYLLFGGTTLILIPCLNVLRHRQQGAMSLPSLGRRLSMRVLVVSVVTIPFSRFFELLPCKQTPSCSAANLRFAPSPPFFFFFFNLASHFHSISFLSFHLFPLYLSLHMLMLILPALFSFPL